MKEKVRTMDIKPLIGHPAMKMTWQHQIDKADLQPVFRQITTALHKSSHPLYSVVDLSHDPQFPIVDTMMGAMRGPFRHPRLAEWLVFGSSRTAQMIGDLLTKTTRCNNIRWFNTEDEMLAYLDAVNM